jgi:hypothetical protein
MRLTLLTNQALRSWGEGGVGVHIERKHDPIHLVLDAHVLAANVNLLILIEGDTRHLQHHLVQWSRLPEGQIVNVLCGQRVLVGPCSGQTVLGKDAARGQRKAQCAF